MNGLVMRVTKPETRLMRLSAKCLCLAVLMLLVCFAGAACADQTGTCGNNLTWSITDNVLTISGSGPMEDYNYGTSPWFNREDFTSVINLGAESIGDYAFYGNTKLAAINPGPATRIGNSAFNSSGLTGISFPDSLQRIGETAFWGCRNLTSVTVPATLTYIGEGAFANCRGLTQITVDGDHEVYTSVNGVLFSADLKTLYCVPANHPMTTYSVPAGVTCLAAHAFEWCNNLRAINLPDGLTEIGDSAFKWVQHITELDIPDTVQRIGMAAFNICTARELTIPEGVTRIEEATFYCSDKLEAVHLPEGIVYIGEEAFGGTGLTSIELPASLETIGDRAFAQNYSLQTVSFRGNSIDSIGDEAFAMCDILSFVNLPEGLSEIGDGAFKYCVGMGRLTIPDSVVTIGNEAFLYGPALLVCHEMSAGEAYALAHELEHITIYRHTLTIPAETTTIGAEAFADLDTRVNILISRPWIQIDDSAFDRSQILLMIPEGSELAQWAEERQIPWLEV